MPEGGVISGFGEGLIREKVGKVLQFERFGFVRIDSVCDDGIVACFGHK
ncbi:MAG: glutamyl-tRNA synthetase [Candidatus Syntrophoarchaeum sp. GoM_oil]|nr:MAG: glutamyl-tRNA synthetase [Candidatus Syntrophoarchaeum sp. GoM_oil]